MRGFVDWKRLLIAVPLLAVIAVVGYCVLGARADASTPRAVLAETAHADGASVGVRKGQVARDFLASSPAGDELRLSDLRGRPVVINFWATWCTSCLAEMPDLAVVQDEFGAENLQVVAVNSGESAGPARAFLETLDAPEFLPVMDPTLVVSDAYGVSGLSTSLFIDKDGVIRATYIGQLSKELMRDYVRAASDGYDAAEAPPLLRLPGTVQARRSLIQVRDRGHGEAEFRSKLLRCDDAHCADEALRTFASFRGVLAIEHQREFDPPRMEVTFEPQVVDLDTLAEALADILAGTDPLYEGEPEIEHQ